MVSSAELIRAGPIVLSLVVIEGLLSVDNALAIAAMALHLPEGQRTRTLRYGIVGAYLFRGLALAAAAWIVANPWVKLSGAVYLIYLMCAHLTRERRDGQGGSDARPGRSFWMTVLQIEIMDLSLSIDNVVAAVALSPRLWIVLTGVFIGILALRFLAGLGVRLIARFPVLGEAAFLLVGYVGVLLCVELAAHVVVGPVEKFGGIVAILVAALLYGSVPGMRTILQPAVRVTMLLMLGLARTFEAVFWVPRKIVAPGWVDPAKRAPLGGPGRGSTGK